MPMPMVNSRRGMPERCSLLRLSPTPLLLTEVFPGTISVKVYLEVNGYLKLYRQTTDRQTGG